MVILKERAGFYENSSENNLSIHDDLAISVGATKRSLSNIINLFHTTK